MSENECYSTINPVPSKVLAAKAPVQIPVKKDRMKYFMAAIVMATLLNFLLVVVFGATLFHFQFQTNLTQTNSTQTNSPQTNSPQTNLTQPNLPQTNLTAELEVDQPNVTQDNEGQSELAGTYCINSAHSCTKYNRAVG